MQLYTRELSADCDTPLSVFARLRDEGNCFLLESAEGGERWGRYSIIGFSPACVACERDGVLYLQYREGGSEQLAGEEILSWLRREVIEVADGDTPDLPFSGGAVGYFSYDMVHRFEDVESRHHGERETLAAFLLVDRFVVFDNLRGSMRLCVRTAEESDVEALLDTMEARLVASERPAPMHLAPMQQGGAMTPPDAHIDQASFEAMVTKAKEYILAGDIFQVVLSQRFSTSLTCDPLHIYRAVRHINPSPYLFYLHVDDTVLIGSSPEILVQKSDRQAIVRPIAGTRPRGKTVEEDRRLEEDLLQDAKELAEHVMLVDLGRNDLGRVCEYGTVHLSESMSVERYSHVMHIVSQVEGRLRDDADALDLLAATFPAGTVSGAPKVRAMQIIDELESEPRGPYAGAIGYISFGGSHMDTAIAIRTAVVRNDRILVQAGAGIVADSDPASEHAECVNKATAMFRAVALAQAQAQEEQS
ncbi:MAG TPA: anthranilate synthase component I [Mariprofundaceae bacterium]|nr:anthranilate synthase component I [Mariprofundaceae bacterium]